METAVLRGVVSNIFLQIFHKISDEDAPGNHRRRDHLGKFPFFSPGQTVRNRRWDSVSVLGVRRPKRGRAWDEGPFPIVSYESYWLKKNYSKWRPSGPGCCIYNFEVQRCLLLWKYIVVTIILLVVLMASHLIYSNAFGKSFKVSQYLHSNATCHQMFA